FGVALHYEPWRNRRHDWHCRDARRTSTYHGRTNMLQPMKGIPLAAALVSGIVALAGYVHAAKPAADEAAIRAQTTSWMKAYNGGDAKAVAALYTADEILMPPRSPSVKRR